MSQKRGVKKEVKNQAIFLNGILIILEKIENTEILLHCTVKDRFVSFE